MAPAVSIIASRFIDKWGRTGFDGNMSGLRLHAELIAS
jgi:hypothetical protein